MLCIEYASKKPQSHLLSSNFCASWQKSDKLKPQKIENKEKIS